MILALAILSIAAAIVLGLTIRMQINAAREQGRREGFFKGYRDAVAFREEQVK